MSSFLDGSDVQYLVEEGKLVMPEGIAVDSIDKNVYFVDSHHAFVGVASISKKVWTPIIEHKLRRPRNIALYVSKGLMFISDWYDSNPRIVRASMDGSEVNNLVTEDLSWPNGVAVDHILERVFWSDAKKDSVESVKLDGTNRVKVPLFHVPHPFAISILGDTLYWSDWHTQ